MNKQFILPLRIYYEDTDAGGVVYWVRLQKNHAIVFCKGLVTIVCVDEDIKPCRIKPELVESLSGN